MILLGDLLARRTHRELEAVAGAHRLAFTRRVPKHIGLQALSQTLSGKLYRRAYRTLTDADQIALRTLQAAGGHMGQLHFQRIFGAVRPYKPWRDDSPRHPWRHPASTAEKLFHMAFIGIVEHQFVLTEEASALLPPLPRPLPVMWQGQSPSFPRAVLVTDVAVLLGTLLAEPAQPQWNRWLPPRALREVNKRLTLQDDLSTVRSELQCGRLRFLHYLAAQARLLSVQVAGFQPTALAWRWLEWPAETRWRFLLETMDPGGALWQEFHLPAISASLWKALTRLLADLPAGAAYRLTDIVTALSPYLPEENALEQQVDDLLKTILTWLGYVVVEAGCCYLTPCDFPTEQGAILTVQPDALYISLPPLPSAAALVHLLSFASPADAALCIDRDTVRRAVGKGYAAPDLVRILSQLQGRPLAQDAAQLLHQWAGAADQLTLQPMLMLTVHNPQIINQLQRDWRLRQYFGTRLSAHHIAIHPDSAPQLLKRLQRRQHSVTSFIQSTPPRQFRDKLDEDTLEYLWIAARVYQKLGRLIELPLHMPGALLDWLAAQLPQGATAALETTAKAALEQMALVKCRQASPSGYVAQDDPDAILSAVQNTYHERGCITIDYYSPYSGETTTRTIEPIALYQQNGTHYVEAWCQLEHDSRTFRVDRILRVRPTGSVSRDGVDRHIRVTNKVVEFDTPTAFEL